MSLSLLHWCDPSDTRRMGYEYAETLKGEQEQRIFLLLAQCSGGLTNNEISRLTGLRISSITARMVELRRKELVNGQMLVEPYGTRTDKYTGVKNIVWRVNPAYFKPSEVER